MLALERQGEDDMSKHHAIYIRVGTQRQDTASQEPEVVKNREDIIDLLIPNIMDEDGAFFSH